MTTLLNRFQIFYVKNLLIVKEVLITVGTSIGIKPVPDDLCRVSVEEVLPRVPRQYLIICEE